jgi:polar amino acid transport system substrate-binding protein
VNVQRPKLTMLAPLALVAVAGFFVTGCGGGGGKTTTSTATTTGTTASGVNSKIAAEVPAAIKSKGTLTVAADATYAPNEFIGTDGKTVEGMSPDLGHALGGVMGLKVKFVNAGFDTIIPGLSSGKYDLGISSFTDTKEREKVVDFVTYFEAGTSFYVKTAGPTITSLADLCGHSVAVERGTTQADDSTAQSKKCKSAGKASVTVHVYPDQNAANLAVSSGRGEVGMADTPVAAYIVEKSNGQFKLTGKSYNTAPYGIAIPKGNGMTKPVLDALKVLMANGKYKTIMAKWGLQAGEITNPTINGAIS